jgi:hypothetical protein
LQHSIMFDELIDLDFVLIGYNKIDKTVWWNNALIREEITPEQIDIITNKMMAIDRPPVIYFETNKSEAFIQLLGQKEYKFEYEDSWMFHSGSNISYNRSCQVKKVETPEDLKVHLETMDRSYRKDDPKNPYGELGDYIMVTERVWHDHHSTNRLEYFTVYKEDRPVAVLALTNFDGIGYINNVGSILDVRGEGFGKVATLYAVEQSIKNGNKFHCLITEEGMYPNEFYKRIGFEARFTAAGYKKQLAAV